MSNVNTPRSHLLVPFFLLISPLILLFNAHADVARTSEPTTLFFAYPEGPRSTQTSPDSEGSFVDKFYVNEDSQGLSHEITYSSTCLLYTSRCV